MSEIALSKWIFVAKLISHPVTKEQPSDFTMKSIAWEKNCDGGLPDILISSNGESMDALVRVKMILSLIENVVTQSVCPVVQNYILSSASNKIYH